MWYREREQNVNLSLAEFVIGTYAACRGTAGGGLDGWMNEGLGA